MNQKFDDIIRIGKSEGGKIIIDITKITVKFSFENKISIDDFFDRLFMKYPDIKYAVPEDNVVCFNVGEI